MDKVNELVNQRGEEEEAEAKGEGPHMHPSVSEDKFGSEESSSAGISSTISPHYNPTEDVILRAEWIEARAMKNLILGVVMSTVLGIALLCVGVYWRATKDARFYLHTDTVPLMNICFGAACLLAQGVTSFLFMRRLIRSNASGKRWSQRRKRGVTINIVEQMTQLVNLLAFVITNSFVVRYECEVLSSKVAWSGFVQWTCWNTIFFIQLLMSRSTLPIKGTRYEKYSTRHDAIGMDVPVWEAWRISFWWWLEQGLIIACGTLFQIQVNKIPNHDTPEGMCPGEMNDCHIPGYFVALVVLAGAGIILYQLLWVINMRRGFLYLSQQPYNEYRMGNQIIRLQTRLRSLAIIVFIVCMIIYTYVDINSCGSLQLSWLGYLPMQIVMTAVVTANTILMTPKRPGDEAILYCWLQEFSWTERDVPMKRDERCSSLPEGTNSEALNKEPMWCFETAVKMLYWSFLCYDYEENKTKAAYSVDTALSLYDLHSFEMLWEPTMDTKCLMGWNNDTVVIAFRGTASMANVASDLKVWRECWPKDLTGASWWKFALGSPKVHSGFYHAYTASGFNMELMGRLKRILRSLVEYEPGRRVRVFVTGHSLGGALATLCAYDVMTHCQRDHHADYEVSCYTFGAPRTGNHSFARLLMDKVPDTWHVINSDDTVTRVGKFFFLFKRGGHRVLINPRGDLIVRPDYIEQYVLRRPGTGSVKDHFLTSYERSMMAVLAAQFGRKSLMGGKRGVIDLTKNKGTRAVLEKAGLTIEEFDRLEREGIGLGLRSATGLVDCSCGGITNTIPSMGRRWINALKPCKRHQGVDPDVARRMASVSGVPADVETGPITDAGADGVCEWPKAIKVQQRHDIRQCRGQKSCTMASMICRGRKSDVQKTRSTWCDSSGNASSGDLTKTAVQPPGSNDTAQVGGEPDLEQGGAAGPMTLTTPPPIEPAVRQAPMDPAMPPDDDDGSGNDIGLYALDNVTMAGVSACGDARDRMGFFAQRRQ